MPDPKRNSAQTRNPIQIHGVVLVLSWMFVFSLPSFVQSSDEDFAPTANGRETQIYEDEYLEYDERYSGSRPPSAQTTAGYSRLRPSNHAKQGPIRKLAIDGRQIPVNRPGFDSRQDSGNRSFDGQLRSERHVDDRQLDYENRPGRGDDRIRSGVRNLPRNERYEERNIGPSFENELRDSDVRDQGRPVNDEFQPSRQEMYNSREPISSSREQMTKAGPAGHSLPQVKRGGSSTAVPSSSVHTDGVQLVADDGGPIAEVLLHYNRNSERELGEVYRDLFDHLGPNVRVQVCCADEESVAAFSQNWGEAAICEGRQVQVVNVNRPITVWARDRRICRQLASGEAAPSFVPVAHSTYDSEKQNDLVLSSLLWTQGLVPSVANAALHLEGGNVVSNRRHIFIGANAFEDNQHRFQSESDLFGELTKLFGRPAIAIKSRDGQTPWIHTDMYLTPIDTRTILLASPAAGCQLLAGRNSFMVNHRDRPVPVEFDAMGLNSPKQNQFDDVAAHLEQLGYQVIRMPALINVQKDWMVTYNNVLMDYQDGRRVVMMPIYQIPELDQAAARQYQALGFEVKPVDVSNIFHLGGALRCLANVTRRLPFEMRLQTRDAEEQGRLQVYSVDPAFNRMRESRPRAQRRPLPPALRERQLPDVHSDEDRSVRQRYTAG